MNQPLLKFVETATKEEIEQLIKELEAEKNPKFDDVVVFLLSLIR